MFADIDLTDPIFHDEAKATAHMEADRWPNGVTCPLCGSDNVHRMGGKTQAGMFLCNDCRDKFTVRTKTIFERSHIPLHKWLMATHLMAASKKSVSALQLQRMLGLGSYRTAWFMCHRIREAMTEKTPSPLGGAGKIVESDETAIGGKAENRLHHPKPPKKALVMTMIERDGMARSFHVANVKARTLQPVMHKIIDRNSTIMTDNLTSYQLIGRTYAGHEVVRHNRGEYARDGVWHVNTAECFFSLCKRAVFGAHHSVSEAHLPRYMAEWDFKFNTRKMKDGERAALALKGAEGKRLTYRQSRSAENNQTKS
ncbi:MAG TPA: IS1595 family transposase [Xanthobacteraceae bacterium]|nr:IS1595 family transposase [Xanthobacteraceae bacterium]